MSAPAGGRAGCVRGQRMQTPAESSTRGCASGGGRGGGRGGRGGGNETRTPRYKQTPAQRLELDHDVVRSRSEDLPSKKGTSGQVIPFVANFYPLLTRPDWGLYHYRVDFKPEELLTIIKKQLMRPHFATFGLCIFDGHSLYTPNRLRPDPMQLVSTRAADQSNVHITIRLVGQVAQIDSMTLHFYNIVVRKCLESLKFEEMGRHFFDRLAAVKLPQRRLELWPGFVTSMRHHETEVLLCVEPIHKVVRMDSVLSIIEEHKRTNSFEAMKRFVARDVVGNIVMTSYNRKTYRVDDIKWELSPKSTFTSVQELKNGKKEEAELSYMKYYKDRYGQNITDAQQPLLVSLPRRKDHHRGNSGPLYLIPELCQMTGLTDAMRANYSLMQEVSTHLHMAPNIRHEKITRFMAKLQGSPEIQKELDQWGLKFSNKLVELPGRVLPQEKIYFSTIIRGNQAVAFDMPDKTGDWTNAFKSRQMMSSVALNCWVALVPQEMTTPDVNHLVTSIRTSGAQVGFKVSLPSSIIKVNDTRPASYIHEIDKAVGILKQKLEMIFVILPNNKLELYSAVKRRCCVDFGIPSQCFLLKGVKNKNFVSIMSKLVIQMNSKLGGVPWEIEMPLKNVMIMGFDVYHCANRKGDSVGALVASTSPNIGLYYSTVSFHKDRNELSSNLCGDITKALEAYVRRNQALPKRIIMYRDGIGEGQLSYVYHTELCQIQNALKLAYEEKELPKFTFIVVTKKINTRLFTSATKGNPPPGAVADDIITLPERHDFFLISQNSRQGTVSPTAYNVLFDQQGLSADQLQRLTYKLCHLYYNCAATVAVPAPCQYAHKLAYLTGMSTAEKCKDNLTDRLYYL